MSGSTGNKHAEYWKTFLCQKESEVRLITDIYSWGRIIFEILSKVVDIILISNSCLTVPDDVLEKLREKKLPIKGPVSYLIINVQILYSNIQEDGNYYID